MNILKKNYVSINVHKDALVKEEDKQEKRVKKHA